MIAGFKQYPATKDSGIEWLGDVPAHWDVRRLGQIGTLLKGRGGSKEDEVDEGIPCVRYGDLYTTHTWAITETRSRLAPTKAGEYTSIRFGDVLFAASGETTDEIGKSAVNLIHSRACCGGDIILFRARLQLDPRFMGYAADCRAAAAQKASMGRGFTVVHIYPHQIKRIALALPPLPEQSAIARFLDHATSHIERYIRAKEKLVTLLEEQKQVLVHDAITGRIDVRTGKPYPAYKPSGVEWLGDVPAHWDVRRLRNVGKALIGLTYGPGDVVDRGEGLLVFRASNIRGGKIIDADNVYVRCQAPERLLTREGDILICSRSGSRALVGKNAMIDARRAGVTFGAFMTVFRSASNQFLRFVFNSALFERQSGAFLTSTINQLTLSMLYSIRVPFPPSGEQSTIIRYLDDAIVKIDRAINQKNQEIDLLREYRTRLIADVVTGKLDVRDATPKQPGLNSVSAGCANETVQAKFNPRLPDDALGKEAYP
ncbi:MAG: restriction endonuclease subunit S [Gammaproteobacteria bacterium]|nr:restriction endonuclease subunit S [Gammaproteobacteria bacterium]